MTDERGRGTVRLEVPGSLEYRNLAVRVVTSACKLVTNAPVEGLPVVEAEEPNAFDAEVISAFGEAFNNVALHAYGGLPAGRVIIEIAHAPDRIEIRMTDDGRCFDPAAVAPPSLDGALGDLPESGMGLFIMRSFMDEVVYVPGPPNVLLLRKSRRITVPPRREV